MEELYTPLRHVGVVYAAAFHPSGDLLITGAEDGKVRLWDFANDTEPYRALPHPAPVFDLAISEDGRRLVTGTRDGSVWIWQIPPVQREPQTLYLHPYHLDIEFSASGGALVTAATAARLWDPATGLGLGVPVFHREVLWAVALSPDGTLLATGGEDWHVRVWDVRSGKQVMDPLPHPDGVRHITFSPDGRWLATGTWWEARIWDMATGRPLGPPLEGDSSDRRVAFHPDGALISTVVGNAIQLRDVVTRRPFGPPMHHPSGVIAVAFSPDGQLLATGSDDGWVRFWEVGTDRSRRASRPHAGFIQDVEFSPDGQLLASGANDYTVRLWDVATGQPSGPAFQYESRVRGVAFSPDGATLAMAVQDGTTQVRLAQIPVVSANGADMERRTFIALGARIDDEGHVLLSPPDDAQSPDETDRREFATEPPLVRPRPIHDLLTAPDGTLYASGSDGVIRSDDGGALWVTAGLTEDNVLSLAAFQGGIFAARDGWAAVVGSRDSGETWEDVSSSGLGILATVEGELYGGGFGHALRKSVGREWNLVGELPGGAFLSAFAGANGHLYAGFTGAGTWRWGNADFIPEWLVASVPDTGSADITGIQTDWIDTHRGMSEASLTVEGNEPAAGDALTGEDDFDWRVATVSNYGRLEFDTLFQPDAKNARITAYAFAMVTSPDDRDVMLSVAGQDLVAAWLNGERLVSNRLMENTFYGFEQFPLKLRGGLNRLLLKVSHNGEWTRTLGWIAGIQFPARSNLESSTDVSDAPAALLEALETWTPLNGGLSTALVTSLAPIDDTLYTVPWTRACSAMNQTKTVGRRSTSGWPTNTSTN